MAGKNSTAALHSALTAARPDPVYLLSKEEMVYFDLLVDSRESTTWSASDRIVVTNLAKMYSRLQDLQAKVTSEDYTLVTEKGAVVSNPIFNVMMQVANSVQSMSKVLGLTAPQRGLNSKAQRDRNDADAAAKAAVRRASSQDLLA